ncbi:hypothetical protein [Sanguibacter sp. 25GB23B1]|uniref:hypothetical protein n=1 Tax=unclassified Sanguibacter TaxID=2645534 RepID=UPI0032AEEA36
MWFWIWCALVVATLTGAFFLGRSLWRRATMLMRALGDLESVASGAPGRVAERIAANGPTTPRGVDVFRDRDELVAVVEERRAVRRVRAADRRAQHTARYEAWRTLDR